jgi:hypothetical protein
MSNDVLARGLRYVPCLVALLASLAGPAAAQVSTFALTDASLRYDVELVTGACDRDGCSGPLTVTLYKKGTTSRVQAFTEAECSVPLDKGGRPLANLTKLYDVASAVIFDDLDFDGEEDFAIKRAAAGYSGFAYTVYLYDPAQRRLVKSPAFSKLVGPGVLDFFKVDRARQRLSTPHKDGCCLHVTHEYAVVSAAPRLARTITDDDGVVKVKEHPLGGDVKYPGPPEALGLVDRWLAAQNQGRFADYETCYATAFTGIRRSGSRTKELDRAGWLEDRRGMFARPMTVSLAFAVASYVGQRIEVRGTQSWASGTYRDRGLKVLELVQEDGQWKIAREELLSSEVVPAKSAPPR